MFFFFNSSILFACLCSFTHVVRMCDASEPFGACVCGLKRRRVTRSKSMNPYHRDILGGGVFFFACSRVAIARSNIQITEFVVGKSLLQCTAPLRKVELTNPVHTTNGYRQEGGRDGSTHS